MDSSSNATPQEGEQVNEKGKRQYPPPPSGKTLIFRRYRTLPDGTVLDARTYGLKVWPIWVDVASSNRGEGSSNPQ